jgi:hypothetical protein
MNPFLKSALTSIVRNLVAPLVVWLVANNVLEVGDTEKAASVIVTLIVGAVFGVIEKFKSRQKLNTALATGPSSEAHVKSLVKSGLAPDTNRTDVHKIPTLTNTGV